MNRRIAISLIASFLIDRPHFAQATYEIPDTAVHVPDREGYDDLVGELQNYTRESS